MKQTFERKKFSSDRLELIDRCNAIIEEYQDQGYDLTLRQLYYQLVARGMIENSQKSYTRIGGLVNDARLAGYMDWDMIVDRARKTVANAHWNDPSEILEACARQFTIDKWANQLMHVEVMCEKQALEGILIPICKKLDIRFTANKGYSSQSMMYRKGRYFSNLLEDGKLVRVLYFGDHDPSGLDMDRDVSERLKLFAGLAKSSSCITVTRAALTMEQVQRYQPPENPAKITDSRSAWYIKTYGQSSWELDALDPGIFKELVEDFVLQHRDDLLWDEAVRREDGMKEDLLSMAEQYRGE
ncbi:hypothetical protein E2P64_07580 [Candidatus Bathyarchaeota archaeon]|nr:hypothetical protein E2P64_07580 [Candidatus Bathyarchaeota archaeon]